MPAPTLSPAGVDLCVNDVHLVGVVRRGPLERLLPSGDVLVGFSVRMARPAGRTTGPRGSGDSIEVAAWTPGVRRRALSLEAGDIVEVHGALRRQVRSGPAGVTSRYEVEASAVKRLARASG